MNCFLSHSSCDKTWFVEQVYDRLPKETTFIDKVNFRASAYTKSEIEAFLNISQVFVYFISNASLESGWVQDEVKIAEELFKENKIRLFIPIILDPSISYKDSRFSPWLKNNFNLKYLGGPKYVAKRIHDEICFLKLGLNPVLKEELSLCLGRNPENTMFVRRYEDFTKPELKMVVASGIPQIGRRTFLKNILVASQLKPASFATYEITMDARGSIEDFIAKLEPISDLISPDDLSNLLEQKIDAKQKLALKVIQELSDRGEIILIKDDNCIVDYSGRLISWFESIITDSTFPKRLVFLLAAKRNLFSCRDDILTISLAELKQPDSISIFSRLLSIRGKYLSKDAMKFWTDLLVGHPGQIKFTLNLLERNSYDERAAENESYLVSNYLENQAAISLQKYLNDIDYCNILRLFAIAEFVSFDLYNQIFKEEKNIDILKNLIELNVIEFVGENHDFMRLNGVFRDYILRNTNNFNDDIIRQIKYLTDDFVKGALHNDDISQSLFLATIALESSEPLSFKKLFPVHVIKAMINIYNRGDNYARVIDLADTLLGYRNNIADNTVQDALYYKCLALARLQDRAVLNEIQQLSKESGTFIKGFYYRRMGRSIDAINEFNKIKNERFIGHRARREIVSALFQLEQYDEALSLARENYKLNSENHYHVHALFKCLIYSSEIDNNDAIKLEAKKLIEKLRQFSNEQAKEMAQITSAQYLAFVESNFTKAYDVTSDTISQYPDSKYPILAQMDIALRSCNYDMAKSTNEIITKYLESHKKVPARVFARAQAYYLAGTGHIEDAQQKLANEFDRLDEAAKEKLLQKLAYYDKYRLE